MAKTTGRLVNVMDRKVGTNLTADVSSGASVLPVDDVVDFNEAGGSLTIEGDTYAYVSIDDEASTITLGSTTTDDYDEGFDVLVSPATSEKVALVVVTGESDAIEARIVKGDYPMYPEGIREPGSEELVHLRSTRRGWVVTDAPGSPKTITVTGALIRTAESGQRVQIDRDGIKAYNASEDVTAKLEAGTGGLELDGSLVVEGGIVIPASDGESQMEIADGRILIVALPSEEAVGRILLTSGSGGDGISLVSPSHVGLSTDEAGITVDGGGDIGLYANTKVQIINGLADLEIETPTGIKVTYTGDRSMALMPLQEDEDSAYERHSFGADLKCYWTVDGDIRLTGIVAKKTGNFSGSFDQVAQLPVGIFPWVQQFFPVIGNSGSTTGRCRVNTDGTIDIQMDGTTNYVALDGITVSMAAIRS